MKKIVAILLILGFTLSASFVLAFPAVQVYKKTSDSVVLIVASNGGRGGSMLGTGSIITKSGLVITNAHVILDSDSGKPFSKVRIFTKPEEVTGNFSKDLVNSHDAEVAAYDKDLDLAVLKVKGLSSGQGIITLANDKEIMVGEEVVAIGHPEQGGLWTLTYGRISSQIADQSKVKGKNVFQTDTSLNRGNSGGPLLDKRGYMVGVNTNIARTGSGGMAITGVNFALKSSVVSGWLGRNGVNIAYGTEALYPEAEPTPTTPEMVKPTPKPTPEPATEMAPEKAPEQKPVNEVETLETKEQEPAQEVAPVPAPNRACPCRPWAATPARPPSW